MTTPPKPLVRLMLTFVFATALDGAVAAAERPYAPSITCSRLQQLIERSGAAVLSTGPRTYDRFVSDRRSCQPTEITEPAWTRSRDSAECFVGYTCKEYAGHDEW